MGVMTSDSWDPARCRSFSQGSVSPTPLGDTFDPEKCSMFQGHQPGSLLVTVEDIS